MTLGWANCAWVAHILAGGSEMKREIMVAFRLARLSRNAKAQIHSIRSCSNVQTILIDSEFYMPAASIDGLKEFRRLRLNLEHFEGPGFLAQLLED